MNPKRLFAAVALAAAFQPGWTQTHVDLSIDQPDFTTWSLAGSAVAQNMTPGNGFTYSLLQLTQPGSGDQGGSGFAPAPLALSFNEAFDFSFPFFIPVSEGLRGDGFTITLSTAPGLGNAGSGLGYEGLNPASVAFAVDTFHFDGDPVSPSLQILAGGSVTPLAATETGLGDAIRNPDFAWIGSMNFVPSGNGDGIGTLTGTITHIDLGSFSVSAELDFTALGMAGAPVYWGFTASNGLATDGHTVFWGAPVAAVPEPANVLLMLAGVGVLLARRRRG